jgi:alpha-galactosidase
MELGEADLLPKGTEIAFHRSGDRDAARYVSDLFVCVEALEHGRWIGLYRSATGHVHREDASASTPGLDSLFRPLHAFRLNVDGQSLHNRWDFVCTETRQAKRPGSREAVVTLKHQVRPITVKVVTRVDGSPVMARYLEISNDGEVAAALSSVSPWCGVLWDTPLDRPGHFSYANPAFEATGRSPYSVGYFLKDDQLTEGDFAWRPLDAETFKVERSTHGRSWGSPYAIVRNEVTGECAFLGLAWSGNYVLEFRLSHGALLSFDAQPLAPAPLRVIAAGETVVSPEVHLGLMHCGLDDAVAHWHRHMRTSVVPPRPEGKGMYTIAGRVVEHPGDWILKEVDIAAEMGVEAYMVDAAWYGSEFGPWWDLRGDWNEGSWLPGGLAGVRKHVHDKGLLFGLWHEAEAISRKSQLYKDHPDWTLSTDDRRECTETLDLSNPDAAAYFRDSVLRIVKEHKLDFYKLDYNVSSGEGGQSVRDGFAEAEAWRHMEALYATYDRVLSENPSVCLENCAAGGGRNDLGMLQRFHYSCESDWSVFPYSIRAINGLSLFLPPEAICYYHNHVQEAHTLADLDTHLRVTLFGVPIYVGFGGQDADRSTAYFERAKRYIALHKGFCRPVLSGRPHVFHHTPGIGLFKPAEWCVLEYGAPDRSRGYVGAFKLIGGGSPYNLCLRGVDLGATYKVTLDNSGQTFRATGRELACEGLPIRLDAALTSELVLYDRV